MDPYSLEFIIPYILFGCTAVLLLFQLYYIFFVYAKLANYKVQSYQANNTTPPVTIIICAHNEQNNLEQYLPSILTQDYPDYEVIVVNDCSSDETDWVLKSFQNQHSNLRVIDIKEHIKLKHSKKFALTLGIKASKNEILLMADADCQPNGSLWLREMIGAFDTDKTEIVLGYSPYFKTKGLLNKLIRFETTHTAMSYLSHALKKDAYMGVGRNLAYTKSLFFKAKGFNAHMHIKSGDDDLFVNHNATSSNVNIAIHPDAQVYSVPKTSWKAYYKQKARHAGASTLYKKRHQRTLATQLITAILFYVLLVVCAVVQPQYWFIALGLYLVRLIAQFIFFPRIYQKLQVKDLLLWLPILDVFYYFYICFNGLFNRRRKQTSWK